MSVTVFLVVLFAAFLHASWNGLVRGGADRVTAMAAVVLGQGLFGLLCLPFFAAPAPESWVWIGTGVLLHVGYQAFLSAAYQTGKLSEVYPLARGAAPLIVAVVSVWGLGVALGVMEWGGILLITCGLASLALVRKDGQWQMPARGTLLALATSVFIAGYALNDGLGARISGSPVAFFGWLSIINAALYLALLRIWRPESLRALPKSGQMVLIGGGASFAAYALVVWAFTQAPISTVAALRETSILFALGIGVLILREPFDLRRMVATFLTVAGVICLRLGS